MPDIKVYNVLLASLSALVSIILFSLSFSLLSPLDMALKYDSNIHKLDVDTVYGPGRGDGGRFFTGFYIDFMKFPKTLQQIEFSTHKNADFPRMKVRTGPDAASGDDENGRVARAELRLAAGDLETAVTILEGLKEPGLTYAGPWLKEARARLDVDGAIKILFSEALVHAQATDDGKGAPGG